MKKFLLATFLLIGQCCIAQSVDSINKIVFSYGRNQGFWGKSGIYAVGEVIELSRAASGDFEISRYFDKKSSTSDSGKIFHQDTLNRKINSGQKISKTKIQYWLNQLHTNKENFNVQFLKPNLTKPTKAEILKTARKYDQIWLFTGEGEDYFDKEDKADARKYIRELQSFSNLDSFITFKRQTAEFDAVVTDNYNGLSILTIQNNDTTEYTCQFYEPLGQPIIRYLNRNYSTSSKIFNLEINTSALAFLPKKSLIQKALSLDNIKEQYITWYLKHF